MNAYGNATSQKIFCMLSVLFAVAIVTTGKPKCTGRWAIHSCGGGNGKRSDIGIDLSDSGISQESEQDGIPPEFLPQFVSSEVRISDGGLAEKEEEEEELRRRGTDEAEDEADFSSLKEQLEDRQRNVLEEIVEDRVMHALIRRLLQRKLAESDETGRYFASHE